MRNSPRKPLRHFGILTVCILGLGSAVSVLAENEPSVTQPTARVDANPGIEGKFVVHEWGTFTTFSGSDGLFLEYRPLSAEHNDLPPFVLDRASHSPRGRRIKNLLRGRVRMETPVTYFYTDRIRQVNVSVDFHNGLLTEFYPPVRTMLPKFDPIAAYKEGEPLGKSRLDWGEVTLIPTDALVPNIEDPSLRSQVAHHIANNVLPTGTNDNHYVQARATDSALVHVRGVSAPARPSSSKDYMEKFLFYRGVGNFQLPYQSQFDEQGRVVLRNEGALPMNSAILVRVRGDKLIAATIDHLDAGQSRVFDAEKNVSAKELSEIVTNALIGEGLYRKEALAMVETWKQSWFTEEGTRVLYMVPPTITDELLPLNIEPRPQETLRVLVGRMEIISPDAERRLLETVKVSSQQRAQFLAQKKDGKKGDTAFPIPESIRSMGRLAEPALARVSKISRDGRVREEANLLIAELRAE